MAAPTYRSASAYNDWNGSTSAIVSKPTGTVEGDLMVAGFYTVNGFYDTVGDLTPPAGWTTISELLSGNAPIMGLYYKVAGASEGSTYTWTKNDGSELSLMIVTIQTGTFDATTPIGTSSGTDWSRQHQPSGSTSVSAPTVTPPSDECLAVFFGFANQGGTWTAPATFTERSDTTNGGPSSLAATKALSTGATGTITATASSSVSANNGGGALVIVRPTAGGGTPNTTGGYWGIRGV